MTGILSTPRFDLVLATPELLELILAGEEAAACEQLGVSGPLGWPMDEASREGLPLHLAELRTDPMEQEWRIRLILQRGDGSRVIGSVSLKGPPLEDGYVEMGWGVSPSHRGAGVATEASAALMGWALKQPGVGRVIATVPENNLPSVRVAQKLGMRRTNEQRRGLPVWARDAAQPG